MADIELRLAAQDKSKRKDMSEVNKRNVKANMNAVTAKVCPVQLALQSLCARDEPELLLTPLTRCVRRWT